jgi:uncharacterized protein YegL
MTSIASDVVGGFNEWLEAQRALEGDARVSLVQFDSDDPFEVTIDGVPLREVTSLSRAAFQPRGMTPLYDAIGQMVGRVDAEIANLDERELPAEDQVVVIITDGEENDSREQTRADVFAMIEDRKKQGWVFVFLGANQDVYEASQAMSISNQNARNWDPSSAGTKTMFKNLSDSTLTHRSKSREQRATDAEDFFPEE